MEKGFQGGGDKLRERGFRVESLARIADMDCDTGGYNLQCAFSTGYLAGESAAKSLNIPGQY